METSNSIIFSDIFKDTETFLHQLNPKAHQPPFISTTFSAMRRNAFQVMKECSSGGDEASKAENLLIFVSKFELEYIETLRSKLREQYIDLVLQKQSDIPNDINMKEVEGYGAISDIAQLAIAIAEWTLELEISAYTLEGLILYGLIKEEKEKHEDYFTHLKEEYSYKKKNGLVSMMEYLIRRAMNFTFSKFSSLALAKGMSKGGFQGKDILDIIISISTSGVVPWTAVAGTLNISWVAGGFLCSHIFQKINDYAVKREVFKTLKAVRETFENNKLHLMTERQTILDLMDRVLNEKDGAKKKWDLGVLGRTVNCILHPSEKGQLSHLELTGRAFNVKEEEDCVVVEENGYNEKEDESGVIVVEW